MEAAAHTESITGLLRRLHRSIAPLPPRAAVAVTTTTTEESFFHRYPVMKKLHDRYKCNGDLDVRVCAPDNMIKVTRESGEAHKPTWVVYLKILNERVLEVDVSERSYKGDILTNKFSTLGESSVVELVKQITKGGVHADLPN